MTTTPAKTKSKSARKAMRTAKKGGQGGDAPDADSVSAGEGPEKPLKTVESRLPIRPGETWERTVARAACCPTGKAAAIVRPFAANLFGSTADVKMDETIAVLRELVNAVKAGDMTPADEMLAAQAYALDAIFIELVRRSSANMGEYLGASETYMRLALKAQSQARSTWESLSKIKSPVGGATFIKQANMANGPQQVNNGVTENTTPAGAPAPAREIEFQPNELIGDCDVVDARTPAAALRSHVGGDPSVEAMGAVHGAKDRRGEGGK